MIALYRSGRQAEALQSFYDWSKALDVRHGQKPCPPLQRIYLQILHQDSAIAPPVESSRHRSGPYGEIERALLAARLVPVLGPGAGRPLPLPGPEAAAEYLAHSLYSEDAAPGPLHRSLAAMAPLLRARGLPCQLLLTSGFDRTLERAFADEGEEVDIVSYIALDRDRGKFLHVAPDGSKRVIDEPNLEVGLASPDRTMILKLNGGTDELSERVRDSYVVSEDDYIDYLARSDASALLPVGLAARLRRSHLLFVDYGLHEWSLRVFLRRLWGEEGLAYRSWAVDTTSRGEAARHWRLLGVEVLDVSAEEAVEEMRRRLADDGTGGSTIA
jgi:SIR2-like domain/Bacterial transcriptional activator domain